MKGRATDDLRAIADEWPTNPLGWLVALCSRRLREGLMARFTSAGYRVSPEQWAILGQLWRQDGLPQQVLAERFHRSRVAAVQLIDQLEKQGLVVRRPHPTDRRSNLIHLTPQGRSLESELIPLAQENLKTALDGIPEEDLATTRHVLCTIINNMDAQKAIRPSGRAGMARKWEGRNGTREKQGGTARTHERTIDRQSASAEGVRQ